MESRAASSRGAGAAASVGVVVVAYNSGDVLGRCLRSLGDAARELEERRGAETSVVVVDNASRERLVIPPLPIRVETVRLEENLGFAPAAKLGAERSPAPLILFLNPDASLERSALVELVAAFDNPASAIAGPLLVAEDARPMLSERAFHSLAREARTQLVGRQTRPYSARALKSGLGRCLTGACLLVDRGFFERVGGFDTEARMYLEDVELCWLAHRHGRLVRFVPNARCVHLRGGSSDGVNFETDIGLHLTLLGARVKFIHRRSGATAACLMRTLMAVGAIPRICVAAFRGSPRRHFAVLKWAVSSGTPPPWDGGASGRSGSVA
jgi:N-acetylglucosaminyl-diphospho-decaprenol L-rhamnosyltransferase